MAELLLPRGWYIGVYRLRAFRIGFRRFYYDGTHAILNLGWVQIGWGNEP